MDRMTRGASQYGLIGDTLRVTKGIVTMTQVSELHHVGRRWTCVVPGPSTRSVRPFSRIQPRRSWMSLLLAGLAAWLTVSTVPARAAEREPRFGINQAWQSAEMADTAGAQWSRVLFWWSEM